MTSERYFDLTESEIQQRAKLTPSEKLLVNDLIKAARNLPENLSIDLSDGKLSVRKRIAPGSAQTVASLRKKSLEF